MKYTVEVDYPNENQIEVEMSRELLDMFDKGEVFYNGNIFGDSYLLDPEDFVDDECLFAKKEALEKNPEFTMDANGNYSDEGEEQVLYSSDYFYSSFEYDGPYETKRGTVKMYLGC